MDIATPHMIKQLLSIKHIYCQRIKRVIGTFTCHTTKFLVQLIQPLVEATKVQLCTSMMNTTKVESDIQVLLLFTTSVGFDFIYY